MAPLFLFLASSLNVELVYIILTSLVKFTQLQCDENEIVEEGEKSTLFIKEIAIADPNRWTNSAKMEDYIQNKYVIGRRLKRKFSSQTERQPSSVSDAPPQMPQINLQSNVKVTFHQKHLFMETFKEYFADSEVIERSLSPDMNRDQVFKAGEGAGRSGSFFFHSHDGKFIIKTISKGELELLLRILPALSQHYKRNPDSLISKTFGAFTVKTDSTKEVHLVLMENTLQIKNKKGLEYIFDLKGSLVDRKTKGKTTSSTTLKDQNFLLAAQAVPEFIKLSEPTRKKLLNAVKSDVDFLAGLGLMDYSLLLGIERLQDEDVDLFSS